MSKGYPTPNIQVGDVTFGCISVYVPNNPEFQSIFAAAIYGLYASMSKEYFWREQGTMSPEQAAFLSARGLAESQAYDGICGGGDEMSCVDIADCIDDDTTVQASIVNQLTTNGYAPSGNNSSGATTNITISPSKQAENLLPASLPCTESQLMATARTIIRQFHTSTGDFFEAVELVTNPIEVVSLSTDGVPVAGALNNVAEFADWLIETMKESYEAAYNQEVENELTCALFCDMLPTCEVSYDMIISMYEGFASAEGYSTPSDTSDFQSIVDWAMSLSLTVSVGTAATFHYLLAQAMKFGTGTVFNFAGLATLENAIGATIGSMDSTWTECDCAPVETPDTYWQLTRQFAISQYGVRLVGNTTYADGGITGAVAGGNTLADFTIDDLGGGLSYRIAKAQMKSLRRGSGGNGTNDYKQVRTATGVGYTGTLATIWSLNFISCNTNDCSNSSGLLANGTPTTKAVRFLESVEGATANDKVRVTEVTLWGYNHSDQKPDGAIWVAAIP